MFTLTNKSDYGLIIISKLVRRPEYIPLSKIVSQTQLPQRFIARIAADLVRSGILISKEGKDGGYRLAKDLDDITLFDFLTVFEPDLHIVKCQQPKYHCNFEYSCNHHAFFTKKLKNIFMQELRTWTLGDFITNN
ncbi:Rrf2 family transcriptional regulator [Candidatus Roizmanbacteria bacterium]|nr:Rrf2 family transcriptional regulator [Candidatus Roizmanbacteria bacterium]